MDSETRLSRLSEIANDFTVQHKTPIQRYYRSGVEMLSMAKIYTEENELEKAYILYLKYLTLFIEKIRNHPEYKSFPSCRDKITVTNNLKSVLSLSERIKEELKIKYVREAREDRNSQVNKEKENSDQVIQKNIIEYQEEKEKSILISRSEEARYYDHIRSREENISQPKIPDRSTKPRSVHVDGLRMLIVPTELLAKFLSLAGSDNTFETCGILAGKLSQNSFKITHLLFPKQSGTSDSCTMYGEEDLFDYQDKHQLITLGWIHTHPSQTAFLSSVDLHNHLSYQLLMPESIAIVLAPKYNQTGFFRLTNYGLNYIGKCVQSGFHPHPKEPPLFEESSHVTMDHETSIILADLR